MRYLLYLGILFVASLLARGQLETVLYRPVKLRVIDENGLAVEGATVSWGYFNSQDNGKGATDKDGEIIMTGSPSGSLSCSIEKDGFYTSRGELWAGGSKKNPYPKSSYTVKLRRIYAPTELLHHKIDTELPALDEPIGFDLELGDWIKPYGAGESEDITFIGTKKINSARDFRGSLVISFPNEGDGIQEFSAKNKNNPLGYRSLFIAPYEAREEGYQDSISQQIARTGQAIDSYRDDDRNHVFRVRTIKSGNDIVRANYGWIYGDFDWRLSYNSETIQLKFEYFLNPDPSPDARSLEPKNQLKLY